MLFTLGLIVLVSAACRDAPPGWVMVGGAAMAATPFVADQRAALVGMAPAVLVVAAAVGGLTWRRRSGVRLSALLPVVALLLVPLGVAVLRAGTAGDGIGGLPLVARLSETFGSTQKQQSADIRLDLLRDGVDLIGERPLVGHGLGEPVQIVEDPTQGFESIGDIHNIVVDLGVRSGLPGVALFALACVVSGAAARRRWTQLASDAHAALVLAAGAALGGLLLKGMFETIFQKYRLAVLLGLLIGIVAAAGSAPKRRSVQSVRAGAPAINGTVRQ